MKQKIGPVAIVIAVIVLIGFCYFMYQKSQPVVSAPPDPRNGPPAYVKSMQQGGGGAPQGGYQHPGQAPGAAGK